MNLNEKTLYFSTSMISSGAKTFWYAFTIPSCIRKFAEKSTSYRTHKDKLMKIAEERNQNESAKLYIDVGDLVGYIVGLSGVGLYGSELVNNKNMLLAWLSTNFISLGWEIHRKISKSKEKNDNTNRK